MIIKFKKIELHNFLSFENAEFDFSNKGYTFVQGKNYFKDDNSLSNGSGKSSLWESISWCLTGETIRGTKEVRRLGSEDDCFVKLNFEIDSDSYILQRFNKPSKLILIKNNENISGKGIQDTKKILSECIPDLTSDLLGSVIILGQGLPNKFSNNTPSGRKEVLEKLSKSSFMIEDIKSRIALRKSELNRKIRNEEDKLLQTKTIKTKCESEIENYTKELESIKDISNIEIEIEKCNNFIHFSEISKTDLMSKIKSCNNLIEDKRNTVENFNLTYNSQIDTIMNKYSTDLEVCKENNMHLKVEIDSLNKEINKLKSITDICPTCGQKLPNVIKPDTSVQESKVDSLKQELQRSIKKYDDINSRFEKEKLEAVNNHNLKVDTLKKEINSIIFEKSGLEKEIENLEGSIYQKRKYLDELVKEKTEHNTKIDSLTKLINTNKEQVLNLDKDLLYINNIIDDLNLHLQIVNKMDTSVKRDFRGYLLNNIINYINKRSKAYCNKVFDTDKINFTLDGNNISISYGGKEYECLSGGERQKVDLIIQFSLRDMLCKYLNFSSNILVLDEITDNLDILGCQKVFDLISESLKDVENIYIISHHTNLQFPIDYQLTIVKGVDGVSRIQ